MNDQSCKCIFIKIFFQTKRVFPVRRVDFALLLLFIVLVNLTSFGGLANADPATAKHDDRLESLNLEHYVLQAGPIKVGRTLNNLSGVTYNPQSKTLFLVNNRPPKIVETDLHGTELRIIDLYGFKDTEGISHINGNMFAILEEKRRTICIVEIDQHTETIDRESSEIIEIDPIPDGNKGPEGLSHDPKKGLFYAVKEKNPRIIYQIPWPEKSVSSVAVSHTLGIFKRTHFHCKTSQVFTITQVAGASFS